MDYDFEDELRGDEEPMNAKDSGIIPAVVVGVILTIANVWINNVSDDSEENDTARSLATLTERVATLSKQVEKLTEHPYVRRDELATVENRVSGLEQRVGIVERTAVQRGR